MLNWTAYDAERRRKADGQGGLGPAQRQALEEMLVSVLRLPAAGAAATWGEVVGYGAQSAAVVRIRDGVPHPFATPGHPLAVKVYRVRNPRFVEWHARLFHRLPVLAGNPRVQQSVTAGDAVHGLGKKRSYVILHYLPGRLLEAWLQEQQPPPPGAAGAILEEVFRLVIDLWAAGLRPWDVRAGNLILDPADLRVRLVDTDACQRTAEELLARPHDWTRRDQGEALFFRRLPGDVVFRILTGSKRRGDRRDGAGVARIVRALAESGLKAALSRLGRPTGPADAVALAHQSLADFLVICRRPGLTERRCGTPTALPGPVPASR
jgi:hypothetical protein